MKFKSFNTLVLVLSITLLAMLGPAEITPAGAQGPDMRPLTSVSKNGAGLATSTFIPFTLDLYERTVNCAGCGTPTENPPPVPLPSTPVYSGYLIVLENANGSIFDQSSWSDVAIAPGCRGLNAYTAQLVSARGNFPSVATVLGCEYEVIVETQSGIGNDDADVTLYVSDGVSCTTNNCLRIHSAAPRTQSQLAFIQQPSSKATVGQPFRIQPQVAVQDANGNTVTSDTSTVTLSKGAASTGQGNLTCTGGLSQAAVNGVASFTGCQFDASGKYTLHATDGSLTPADSNPIAVCELSGPVWVQRFPGSTSISDLVDPFQTGVRDFVGALSGAGANVIPIATYRPPQRAYLMHYSGLIANGQMSPGAVPVFPGPSPQEHNVPAYRGPDTVDICWVHTDQAGNPDVQASIAAAQQMLAAYGIVSPAAYPTNHSLGVAIDMNISWRGNLKILDANGNLIHINSKPRTGMNQDLWVVGATYGVRKLPTDPPHWSIDGH